ncbi:MAG: pyruvate dehydrogenase complex dihydrolipoamide acetyltransferase [Gemmatimonadetes bacterium]|nr:pyruvate dehydrogenase complex dihydrolipoamide acetyltransferase [Gemmatimonadota bacterium]
MATKVVMEALSPTMEEGRLVKWLKQEGDAVDAGDVLAEVETDKAVMELPARGDGVLRKVLVPAGSTVPVGSLVAVIAAAEEDISALLGETGKGKGERVAPAPAQAPARESAAPRPAPTPTFPVSPFPFPEGGAGGVGVRVKASPLARRIARERGVDLTVVRGSGPGGRIIKRDLERVPAGAAAPAPFRPGTGPAVALPSAGYEDVPLTQIRKTIARRLAESLGPVPHFFLTVEIDMERAWDAREALNALGEEPKITFNDIIVKVVAQALQQHRECNAWWQGDFIRYFREVHIGMAVAVDQGLITPVIRHADHKSLRQIALETRDLSQRARERKLKPEEYTGSTFSVSNLGMLGIHQFTAVINPPEAGIVAVGGITQQPVVDHGTVTVRRRMRMTMSCDHRVIDGATGARFLQTVRRMLENPLAMVW